MGTETDDDAAVYRLTDELAVVLTTDFFTPIVDDPYDFGRIAAANALSDVYAMGGEPRLCLNLMAFPRLLGTAVAADVLRGAGDVVAQAGALVVGGHTIEDTEPKYGLCVLGLLDPRHLLRNGGALPGDVLFLTKPLGTGLMTTGLKRGEVSEEGIAETVELMATLNAAAGKVTSDHAGRGFVHACTDLTGFGLAGHVHEMAQASGCAAQIDLASVPIIEGALDLAQRGITPGKTRDVKAWAQGFTSLDEAGAAGLAYDAAWNLLADPQTSGGLIVAVDPADADEFERDLQAAGAPVHARIGRFAEGDPHVFVH